MMSKIALVAGIALSVSAAVAPAFAIGGDGGSATGGSGGSRSSSGDSGIVQPVFGGAGGGGAGGGGGGGERAAFSEDDLNSHPIIDGEFKIQPYLLPNGQGYRHLTSMINEANSELVLFGGLGDGPPSPPTPMNYKVYTLDLDKAPSEQEWEERSTDDVIPEPWFTTTRGFIQFGDRAYLACDDPK